MPREKKGEKKVSKKALKAMKEAEKLKRQTELGELQKKVSDMLSYKNPPTPLEFVQQSLPQFTSNPWVLIHDQFLANEFLRNLNIVLSKEEKATSPENEGQANASPVRKADRDVIIEKICEISSFAAGQPVFFITDQVTLSLVVQILNTVIQEDEVFSSVLSILLPTAQNHHLTGQILECRLVDAIMRFVDIHMPEMKYDPDELDAMDEEERNSAKTMFTAEGAISKEGNSEGSSSSIDNGNGNGGSEVNESKEAANNGDNKANVFVLHKPSGELIAENVPEAQKGLRHAYSEATFGAVMNMVHSLSASSQLRELMKQGEDKFLHLRGLASGYIKGFSAERRMIAQRCLQYFVHDSYREKGGHSNQMGAAAVIIVPRGNEDMLAYRKGHIHKLYCDGLGVESSSGGTFAGRARKTFTAGFADQPTLDSLNNLVKKRSHKARLIAF